MKRNFDMGLIELAMRVFERTRLAAARHPDFVMAEVVAEVVRDFGCAESTAFRQVRVAVDVLGIHYDGHVGREAKKQRKRQDAAYFGQRDAAARGWPNGKPGRATNLDRGAAHAPSDHAWKRPA